MKILFTSNPDSLVKMGENPHLHDRHSKSYTTAFVAGHFRFLLPSHPSTITAIHFLGEKRISRDAQRRFTRSWLPPTRLTPGKKGSDSHLDLPRGIRNKTKPYGKNHIGKRLDKRWIVAEKFPDYSLDPVSLNRLPYTVDAYSQPIARSVIRHINQTEVLTAQPLPLVVHLLILPGFNQQHVLGKGMGSHAARGCCFAGPELNSQPLTTLGPTTVDDGTAVFCLHSGSKAMGAVSFEVTGLKSSLAHDRLPFSLLLRPLEGLPLIFAVLQQLEPCVTQSNGNTPESTKKSAQQ
jgi:hypothetical protein